MINRIDVFEGFLWFKYFWLPFIVIRIAEGAVTARAATHREALPHAA